MKLFASDFDHTLFVKNQGIVQSTVDYILHKELPVWIISYRAPNQAQFIINTVRETGLTLAGVSLAGDRKKNPSSKAALMENLLKDHEVEEAIDNEESVVIRYRQLGIKCKLIL